MWTLLQANKDWEAYRDKLSKDLQLSGMQVDWGAGPREYPCLVCSAAVSPLRVMSAYVYVRDAESLLAVLHKGTQQAASGNTAAVAPTMTPTHDQDAFNKSAAANLLVLAHYVRNTLCVSDVAYEQKYNEALHLVDEVSSERRDAVLAGLDPTNKNLVERLRPKVG